MLNSKLLSLAVVLLLGVKPCSSAQETLTPAQRIFPRGDVFPFMGYSGNPARDALHGFTVAGPDYGLAPYVEAGHRAKTLAAIRAAGLPYPAFVGLQMNFHDKEKKLKKTPEELRAEITRQVLEMRDDPLVCWWYVGPEELRFWVKEEMDYLSIVTETIRQNDPQNRPIWMYEPNHRNAENLARSGVFQNIIGKGSYVNLAGRQKERVWMRWSIEQEVEAIAELAKKDRINRVPLVVAELCQDPADPAEDHLIPQWVRHDIYLGLISGGRGVAIWSLFKRPAVKRTWPIWYDAYAAIADELCGSLDLGRVFLNGVADDGVKVEQTKGPASIQLIVGDKTKLETATTTDKERGQAIKNYPPLSSKCLRWKNTTWVFVCNSHVTDSVKIRITLPKASQIISQPEGVVTNPSTTVFESYLQPLQVAIYQIR